jgi:hypothetical protein
VKFTWAETIEDVLGEAFEENGRTDKRARTTSNGSRRRVPAAAKRR